MIINNKTESFNMISKLKINRFAKEIFKRGETIKIIDFLQRNPAEFYAIRDKSQVGKLLLIKFLRR